MNDVIKRKVISSIVSVPISSLIIPLYFIFEESQGPWYQYFQAIIYIMIYLFPINLVYGNLVSILLEVIFIRFRKTFYIILNGIIHVGFGSLVGMVFGSYKFYLIGATSIGIYYIADQYLKKYLKFMD